MKTLVEQMYQYASYHRNGRNKALHFLGVPSITFALLVPMSWIGLSVGTIHWQQLTLAMAFVVAVSVYYFLLDVPLALGMVSVIAPLLALAHWVGTTMSMTTGLVVFLVTFVGGWIIQLVGHVFEGRKPALADNILQVFVSPIFLLAEALFAMGFRKDTEAEVERLLAERGLYGKQGSDAQSGTPA